MSKSQSNFPTPFEARVANYFSDNEGHTIDQCANSIGVDRKVVSVASIRLKDKGWIVAIGTQKVVGPDGKPGKGRPMNLWKRTAKS